MKAIKWNQLTENQKNQFVEDNREYLVWCDGSEISRDELEEKGFYLVNDGKKWSLTLSDADFYIHDVIF